MFARSLSLLLVCLLLLGSLAPAARAAESERLGPPTLGEATRELERLGKTSKLATLVQYGRSAGKSPLLLLRIAAPGTRPIDQRPAVFVGANISGDRPLGTLAALDLARSLVEPPAAERAERQALLKRVCFYVAPILNPDAHDSALSPLAWGRRGNGQSLDADRDGTPGEDGPADLDGDGRITQLRIPDPAGRWVPDPRRPDLMVLAEASLGEKGRYRLEVEGRDEDGDGRFNEDPPQGVQPARNFAHAFPYPAPEAGPWASSAPESKALMDFLLARPQVALACVYGRANLLLKLPKAGARARGQAAKLFLPEDRRALEQLQPLYQRHLRAAELPVKRPAGTLSGGSLASWLYYQFGALTLELDVWDAPSEPEDSPEGPKALKLTDLAKLSAAELQAQAAAHDALVDELGAPSSWGSRALAADLESGELTPATLAGRLAPYAAFASTPAGKERSRRRGTLDWWAGQGVASVTSWTPVELSEAGPPGGGPPGGEPAEAGGEFPLAAQFPPREVGEAAIKAHTAFVLDLAERVGRVEIRSLTLTPLGAGVVRVEVVVGNAGEFPSHTAMAALAKVRRPIRVELSLEGGALVTGRSWAAHERIAGSAQVFKHTWLVRAQPDRALKVEVQATSQQASSASRSVTTPQKKSTDDEGR